MSNHSNVIICRRFKTLDLIIFGFFGLILMGLTLLSFLSDTMIDVSIEKSLPSWWFIFVIGICLYQFSAPNIVIFDDGIEVSIFKRKFIIPWEEVIQVKKYKYYAIFKVEKLTSFNRLVGIVIAGTFKPSFSISSTSANYSRGLEFVKNKLGTRFVAYTK